MYEAVPRKTHSFQTVAKDSHTKRTDRYNGTSDIKLRTMKSF